MKVIIKAKKISDILPDFSEEQLGYLKHTVLDNDSLHLFSFIDTENNNEELIIELNDKQIDLLNTEDVTNVINITKDNISFYQKAIEALNDFTKNFKGFENIFKDTIYKTYEDEIETLRLFIESVKYFEIKAHLENRDKNLAVTPKEIEKHTIKQPECMSNKIENQEPLNNTELEVATSKIVTNFIISNNSVNKYFANEINIKQLLIDFAKYMYNYKEC